MAVTIELIYSGLWCTAASLVDKHSRTKTHGVTYKEASFVHGVFKDREAASTIECGR